MEKSEAKLRKEAVMKPQDSKSYLMLFCGLLLARRAKASLEQAVGILPLSDGALRLAGLLANSETSSSALESRQAQPAAQAESEKPESAGSLTAEHWWNAPPANPPRLEEFLHRDREQASVIETKSIRLRCQVCFSEAAFSLDAGQLEHLRHRGHLEFNCYACGVTSFWEPASPLGTPELPGSKPMATRNILLVGNDRATLELLHKVLQAWDAHVEVVPSGKEALQRLMTGCIDVMISELHPEDMEGAELARRIADSGLLSPERVLFIGTESRRAVQQLLDSTGSSYCPKPLGFQEFASHLESLFSSPPGEPEPSPAVI